MRFGAIVNVHNLDLLVLVARQLFVAEKVVFQTVNQSLWHVTDFNNLAKRQILFQHRDDLVVSLIAVDHP